MARVSSNNRIARSILFLTVIISLAGLTAAQSALGDTAPVVASASIPGSDPTHQTPFELLISQIASHIAGHTVTVQCENSADWATLIDATGGDPSAESGIVATQWNSTTGQLVSLSSTAELASGICQPLSDFAAATSKPTKCSPTTTSFSLAKHATHSRSSTHTSLAAEPCYLGDGKTVAPMNAAYWSRYAADAVAILTLAHESIHLSGIVGGQLANGLTVGDPQAEAKADCYGMQWMPYVAEQLGDTPDDARAIASYIWDDVYPLSRAVHPAYWSASCRPGGTLDTRTSDETAWP